MIIAGEYRIPANKQAVWDALNNPEVLKDSLPGCEKIEKTSDTEMTATVTIKLGPVKARFAGKVTLSDLNPPNSYTLTGDGQGGAAGFASGAAKVHLAEDGDVTILTYTAEAKVGGKLAQIGSRLIDSTSKKLAAQFFGKLADIVGGDEGDEPSEKLAAEQETPATPPAQPNNRERGRGLPTSVWVGGVSIIAIILVLLFTGVF